MKIRELIQVKKIDNTIPLNDHVLIKVDRKNDKIDLGADLDSIYIDTSFKVGHHSEVEGVVVSLPTNDNEIPIIVKDKVWFDYFTGFNSYKIECKKNIYYLIPYYYCYAAIHERKNIVLNKWILGDKVKKEFDIALPKDYYYDDIYKLSYVPENSKLKIGDKVRTKTSNYPVLEYVDHLRFDGKEHYVMQEKDIVFVY